MARFLTSGHTNVNRLLDIVAAGRTVPIGFHEFLQAVMLGDRMHYAENFSDVINLYAADGKADQSHFNRLGVLARVMKSSSETSEFGTGYVKVEEVCRDCESIGMTNETTFHLIGFLTEKRLLATETLARDWLFPGSSVKATAAAQYYVNELAATFSYLDLVLADTKIGNDNVRAELNSLTKQIECESDRYKRVLLRVQRGKIFEQYLTDEFSQSSIASAGSLFDKSVTSLIARLHSGYPDESENVVESARSVFGRTTTPEKVI